MKLYFSPGACSLAPHIVLADLGLKYELVRVDLGKKTYAGGDFTRVNPKGSVPALELDNGEVLTEAAVVLQYLADQKPDAGLIPKSGSLERYRTLEWMNFISSEIHKGFAPLFRPNTPDDYKPILKENLKARFNFISGKLANQTFLLGHYSVADAYLFTCLSWASHVGVDLTPWPKLMGLIEGVRSRPGTQAALKQEGLLK